MPRFFLALLLLVAGAVSAQAQADGALAGRIEGKTYTSATGAFSITIPVLPELGGRISDTPNTVTFQDDYNFVCTIAALPMDASQRWEHSTRSEKDYLAYFFANFVMPDFQASFRGAHVESARFAPSILGGSLIVYTLLPGGSMFEHKLSFADPNEPPPVAKRGNLLIVRHDWIYILSTELAERVLEPSTYHKTTDEENEILRQRLVSLVDKMKFTAPASAPATAAVGSGAAP